MGLTETLRGSAGERVRYLLVEGFLILCLLGGGAARPDVLSLLYLRPFAILCLVALLVSPGRWETGPYRILFVLLGLFAATMAVQLIPLPPEIWLNLPGHGRFSEAAVAAGQAQPWRPISLTPDLTLNSLLALLPSLVVLVGAAAIREDQRRALLPILICFVFADAVWGGIQFASGGDNWTYLYAVTNPYSPVGFFSNRNHHALFLALGLPMLAIWIGMPARSRQQHKARLWIGLAGGLFLIPMILVAGSRAGAVLGGIGLVFAYLVSPPLPPSLPPSRRRLLRVAACLLPLALIVVTAYADRAISLERVEDASALSGEVRLEALPILFNALKDFFPEGTGFGAFDPVFRIFEPDGFLTPTYLNHAHNDLIELALTGGIPALLIFLAFLWVFLKRWLPALGRNSRSSRETTYARLGGMMILLVLAASIVDYPLRSPLMSVAFTIACVWLVSRSKPAGAPAEAGPATTEARALRGGKLWVARLLIVAGGIGLLWMAMGVTVSLILGQARPDLVLPWWPFDAETRAAAAAQMVERRPLSREVAEAGGLAQASLRREPVSVAAARTLALVAALNGNQPQAERLASYAETLSRRDLGVQFWLIESNVRKNDIQGALLHYDRALRTSLAAPAILYPVLLQASADPGVRRPLANLMARRPPWWADFADQLIAHGPSPVAIEEIIGALRLDPQNPSERTLLTAALEHLVDGGNYGLGFDLYRRSIRAAGPTPLLVRNGNFEAENPVPPIDWALSDEEDLQALMQPRAAGGRALAVLARNGRGGPVARQLLMLPPGNYRLTAVAGGVAGASTDRPQMTVSCAQPDQILLDLRLPESPDSGSSVGQDFTVPSTSCAFQWLRINVSSWLDRDAPNTWIDDIAVRPVR